ncbi:hypothetical protein [Candidatus Cyanaurora vandensis]|uniref:hypothetical protein n=1 Tax=Candidatus Cyanaurora vandensis TaxID=2714958 RepID=UPI00257F1A24|nr:hypothetical protein [Candidatus Cyanaurora vandensis]
MTPQQFRVSPLVRYTLYGLLLSLVLPLPFLLIHRGETQYFGPMVIGVALGWGVLVGLMSQRVVVDGSGVRVVYAPWVPQSLVKGWQIRWDEVAQLKTRPTGQGGRVHYLVNRQDDAFLLPMRIAGFAQFLRLVAAQTTIDTSRVKPLAQPWMYLTLLVCVGLMLLVDLWVIITALGTAPA